MKIVFETHAASARELGRSLGELIRAYAPELVAERNPRIPHMVAARAVLLGDGRIVFIDPELEWQMQPRCT